MVKFISLCLSFIGPFYSFSQLRTSSSFQIIENVWIFVTLDVLHVCIFPNNHFSQTIYWIILFFSCLAMAPFCWFLFPNCCFLLMNIICSVISWRILKCLSCCSVLFTSSSMNLSLECWCCWLPYSVLLFVYFGILVSRFISRFSPSHLWFPRPAEDGLPRLPSIPPIPPSSTQPLSLHK